MYQLRSAFYVPFSQGTVEVEERSEALVEKNGEEKGKEIVGRDSKGGAKNGE